MDADVQKALQENLTVSVKIAARAFGIGLNACYSAVEKGDIPSVRIGGAIKCPTAPIRKMLGIEHEAVV